MSATLTLRGLPRRYDTGDDIALEDGAWQRDGLVMRWVPTPMAAVTSAGRVDPDAIACPICHARTSQGCRTATGKATASHHGRVVPRHCRCGAALERYKHYCDPCRLAANKRVGVRRERQRANKGRKERAAA